MWREGCKSFSFPQNICWFRPNPVGTPLKCSQSLLNLSKNNSTHIGDGLWKIYENNQFYVKFYVIPNAFERVLNGFWTGFERVRTGTLFLRKWNRTGIFALYVKLRKYLRNWTVFFDPGPLKIKQKIMIKRNITKTICFCGEMKGGPKKRVLTGLRAFHLYRKWKEITTNSPKDYKRLMYRVFFVQTLVLDLYFKG